VIVARLLSAQAHPMTWEEKMFVERIRDQFRPRGYPYSPSEARRTRSNRIRYFVTVFGAIHFAERIDARRVPIARRGQIAL
jgi:hypothetical protein